MFFVYFALWVVLNGKWTTEIALFGVAFAAIAYFFSCRFMGFSLKTDVRLFVGVVDAVRYGWLLLGAVMVVCNLIPYFGPWLGAAPVALFAAEKGLWGVLGGIAVVFAAQQIESLVVSPRVIGDAAQMHPALVIVSLLAGGWLAGLPGMFYAIPAMLCMRAALKAVGESRRQI